MNRIDLRDDAGTGRGRRLQVRARLVDFAAERAKKDDLPILDDDRWMKTRPYEIHVPVIDGPPAVRVTCR